jgi:chromatin remodeling complex protein RSC6|tara:strand:+ start:422 stop:1060 length:639 start_codon:yes stop_codon:yes gene_type:complete
MSSKQAKKSQKQTEQPPVEKKVIKKAKETKPAVTEPVAPPQNVEVPVSVPVPVPVPVPEVISEPTLISTGFSTLHDDLHEVVSVLARLKVNVRSLEKSVNKEMKQLDRINAKKNKNKGTRAPSGFVKPTKISDELAKFLGKEKGSMMARTDVTKEMTGYIRLHKLQDKDNGRKILPDANMKKLLKVSDSEELTYFNLQKFMSPHFEKAVKVV